MTSDTSASLLQRLRDRSDDKSWKRLTDLYTPLIQHWLRGRCVPQEDADDVMQEVFLILMRELPDFQYDPARSFRAWLRQIVRNCLHAASRRHKAARERGLCAEGGSDFRAMLDQQEDLGATPSELQEREENLILLRRALELIRQDFTPATGQAFQRYVLEGVAPAQVAAELGIKINAVYVAASRVKTRLREELQGLVDLDS